MSPRLVALLSFVAAWVALNAWGARRDRLAQAGFEITAPPGFAEHERTTAAMVVADDDHTGATALVKKGGVLFLHFENDSPPELEYLEVIEIEEDAYPLRPDEDVRRAIYGSGKLTIGNTTLDVLDSRVTRFGKNDAVAARLTALVGGKPVRLFQYLVPTDRGRAQVDCFCLVAEEDKYRPLFDAMIAGARGVAYRPVRLPWTTMALACGAFAVVAFFLARRLGRKRLAPARPPAPEEGP